VYKRQDNKKKSVYLKTLTKNSDPIVLRDSDVSKEAINNYAGAASLFGDKLVVVVENIISEGKVFLNDEELKQLKDSQNTFIFIEDKLLASNEKKYKKFAEIVSFEEKKTVQAPKINTFAIADAFGQQDKIKAWILYREAVDAGVEPEPISGILFWKIKTMLLNGTRVFTPEALKKQSSELVSLYHRAHRGETDFVIGLEQFILSFLSK